MAVAMTEISTVADAPEQGVGATSDICRIRPSFEGQAILSSDRAKPVRAIPYVLIFSVVETGGCSGTAVWH
jgi:hypothetical protein